MFVAAVCFRFLIKLKWPKSKNIYDHWSNRFKITFNNDKEVVRRLVELP